MVNCTPNKSFKIGCNTCKCDSSGILSECSTELCGSKKRITRASSDNNLVEPPVECSIFVSSDNGGWHITIYEEPFPFSSRHKIKKILQVEVRSFDENGYTGENFRVTAPILNSEVFNTYDFYLTEPIFFISTSAIKPTKPTQRTTTARPTTTARTTTTVDPDLTSHVIIRNVTIEEIDDPNFTCEPLKPFLLECNTCWCKKNGKGPRECTRIACNPKTYPSLDGTTSTTIPSTFKPVTSTEKGEPSVENLRKVSFEEIDDPNFTCEPLKPFQLECNTCWCKKNGKGPRDCTRIACNPKTYPSLN